MKVQGLKTTNKSNVLRIKEKINFLQRALKLKYYIQMGSLYIRETQIQHYKV